MEKGRHLDFSSLHNQIRIFLDSFSTIVDLLLTSGRILEGFFINGRLIQNYKENIFNKIK